MFAAGRPASRAFIGLRRRVRAQIFVYAMQCANQCAFVRVFRASQWCVSEARKRTHACKPPWRLAIVRGQGMRGGTRRRGAVHLRRRRDVCRLSGKRPRRATHASRSHASRGRMNIVLVYEYRPRVCRCWCSAPRAVCKGAWRGRRRTTSSRTATSTRCCRRSVLGSWVGVRRHFPPLRIPNCAPRGFAPRS